MSRLNANTALDFLFHAFLSLCLSHFACLFLISGSYALQGELPGSTRTGSRKAWSRAEDKSEVQFSSLNSIWMVLDINKSTFHFPICKVGLITSYITTS